jgi:dihydrolipoamide dehydrogenase
MTGLGALAKQRKVTVIEGIGTFTGANTLVVGDTTVTFENAIIAAGSQPTKIPVFPNDDPRLRDSSDALALPFIPPKLLIVGGGIIGLEMATVYHALGSEIHVVELMDQIIPGCDKDLVTPLFRKIKKQYKNIWLESKVSAIDAQADGLKVTFESKTAPDAGNI